MINDLTEKAQCSAGIVNSEREILENVDVNERAPRSWVDSVDDDTIPTRRFVWTSRAREHKVHVPAFLSGLDFSTNLRRFCHRRRNPRSRNADALNLAMIDTD